MATSVMQLPTHSNLKVVTSSDAKAALFLVECQLIHPVRRRPDDAEKAQIGHGQVFIWLDGAKGDGLERWTDGRSWGPSRCRDDFLIYEEKTGEHRLTKSTFTARRNTHGDPGALWHLIAYYYADETNTLVDMYTDPEFQRFTSQMAAGYFVSNRKDKSRKAKEVPAAVDPSPLSRYDQLVESLQQTVNALTPTSSSQPQYITNNNISHSRSPPRHTHSPASQRRHELARLNTSFDDRISHNYESSTEGALRAGSRHTLHAPKSYAKVFAQDYHHLPPPEATYAQRGGGGGGDAGDVVESGGSNNKNNVMMDIDDEEEEDARYHSRGRYNNRIPSPSTESSNSPGLSPTSSGSSPIDVEMESDVLVLDHNHHHTTAANHHHHHHPYARVSGVAAPTPIRPSSVPRLHRHRHSNSHSHSYRSPATPHSTSVPSPRPNFASSSPAIVAIHQNVQFERGGVDMDTIGMEDGTGGDGASPSGPTRNALDETVIQTFNSRLHGFF